MDRVIWTGNLNKRKLKTCHFTGYLRNANGKRKTAVIIVNKLAVIFNARVIRCLFEPCSGGKAK